MPIYKQDECNAIIRDIMHGEKTPEFQNEISRRMLKIALDFAKTKANVNRVDFYGRHYSCLDFWSESQTIQFLLKKYEDNGKASLVNYIQIPNEWDEELLTGYRMKLINYIQQMSEKETHSLQLTPNGVGVNDRQAAQMPVAAQRWEELSYKFQTLRAALEWLERPSCQWGNPYQLFESDLDAIDVIRLASTNISMLAQAEDSEAEYLLEPDLLLELQRLIKLGGLGSAHSYHALFTACNRDFECEKFKAHSKAVKEWQASERNAGKFWTTLAAARESNEIRVANPIEDYEAGGHLSYVHGEIDYD